LDPTQASTTKSPKNGKKKKKKSKDKTQRIRSHILNIKTIIFFFLIDDYGKI